MKPSERLNRSYTLAETTVEVVVDSGLVSVPAKVTLELSPRPKVIFDCAFTWADVEATNEIGDKREVGILLNNGRSVDAVLGSPTTLGGGKIRLTMIPKSELVTVRDENSNFTRCKFALINFPSVWGEHDVKRYPDPSKPGTGLIYQRFQLQADPWLVDIIGVDSVMGVHFGLLQRGGSALTHTGTIVRTDGQQFSSDELKGFLATLHLFLSFARGSYCGLTFLSGHDSGRTRVWEQWGTYKVEPWQRELPSWLDPSGSHHLSSVFDGFLKLLNDPTKGDGISKVIQWYLRGNESNEPEVGVVLAHAALERLSFLVNGPKSLLQHEGDWMADALRHNGINPNLPAECSELTSLDKTHQWSHGPHALTVFRNDLVHPDNRSGPFHDLAMREAQSLGLHYIELMILRMSGFTGQFVNRLKGRESTSSRIEAVPWAPSQTQLGQ